MRGKGGEGREERLLTVATCGREGMRGKGGETCDGGYLWERRDEREGRRDL